MYLILDESDTNNSDLIWHFVINEQAYIVNNNKKVKIKYIIQETYNKFKIFIDGEFNKNLLTIDDLVFGE